MAFDLTDFARLRPYVFHLTNENNFPSIRRGRQLHPARDLLHRAGEAHRVRQHRPGSLPISIDGERLQLRDQAPLKRGNVAVADDWAFEDLLELLNGRVFFWPGTADGPIPPGQRHFARYAEERVVILRVPTPDLLVANEQIEPLFCKWNSGAPRWSRGVQPQRGPGTFGTSANVSYRAREVVELTFTGIVALPGTTMVAPTLAGPWTAL